MRLDAGPPGEFAAAIIGPAAVAIEQAAIEQFGKIRPGDGYFPPVRKAIAEGGAYALGRKVDNQIITELDTTGQTTITITLRVTMITCSVTISNGTRLRRKSRRA
jgi:hypothetical protein